MVAVAHAQLGSGEAMGKQFSKIEAEHKAFIERQRVFFVASAAPKGRVNVSPKGMSTLRVLGDNDVAYLDCTGSGSETRAHLLASEDKRLTIMFCAFEGDPVILRLYGQGQSVMRGTPNYARLLAHFEEIPGARQIVRLAVDLVQTSCGMGVPLFGYQADRQNLIRYWTVQGIDNLRKYWGLKNVRSIDGLPTEFVPEVMAPPR
jgi:pyridoxamine 5'-phosphate oxidase-like protein